MSQPYPTNFEKQLSFFLTLSAIQIAIAYNFESKLTVFGFLGLTSLIAIGIFYTDKLNSVRGESPTDIKICALHVLFTSFMYGFTYFLITAFTEFFSSNNFWPVNFPISFVFFVFACVCIYYLAKEIRSNIADI